jgi:hypothetical protein
VKQIFFLHYKFLKEIIVQIFVYYFEHYLHLCFLTKVNLMFTVLLNISLKVFVKFYDYFILH